MNYITFLLKIYAIVYPLLILGLLQFTWYSAFFNGDQVTVTINDYGEKWVEFTLIPVFNFIAVIGWFFMFTDHLMPELKTYVRN